jgi:hypothetical protein
MRRDNFASGSFSSSSSLLICLVVYFTEGEFSRFFFSSIDLGSCGVISSGGNDDAATLV